MSSLPNNPELRLNDLGGGTVGPFGRPRPLALAAAAPRTGGKKTHPGKAILAGIEKVKQNFVTYLPGAGVALIKKDAPPGRGLPLHSGLLNPAIPSNVGNSGV